jgi:hypothetical protein
MQAKEKYFSFETKIEVVKMLVKGETMKKRLRNYLRNWLLGTIADTANIDK